MSNFQKIILITILSLSISKLLKTKTTCVARNGDCDLTSYCCGSLVCKDYRCVLKGTKENQVPWAPKGEKCDYSHHCKKGLYCQSHRCDKKVGDDSSISDVQAATQSKKGSLSLIEKLTAARLYEDILKKTKTVRNLVASD
jgi:hypothetical protein